MMRGEYCSIHTVVLSCLRCLEQASGLISARFLDMPGLATPLQHRSRKDPALYQRLAHGYYVCSMSLQS